MSKFYAVLVALFSVIIANAQTTSKVTGTVKDAEGKALQAVTVSLLRTKDSSLVKLAVTDKAGAYELINIKSGKYLLSYTSVGFAKNFSKAIEVGEAPIEMPEMTLAAASKDMAAVTVVSRRP
ncbi:MAG: hypothetical protein JWP88_1282, partial [Flaviaesturariibacter sp.]|nr:hypothetical protein [Flaviaesturariibacter sp.]